VISDKPFSPACARNSEPIAQLLVPLLQEAGSVLEIGSGTGQHAVYFGARLPHLVWQTSDLQENHPGIRQWLAEAALPNVLPPLHLDVNQSEWPAERVGAAFTANTLHIVAWSSVQNMFSGVSRVLDEHGLFCVYGPFRYGARHTAESNARFDALLRTQNPSSGIRDFEEVRNLAQRNSMTLQEDHSMPANNRLLIFRKHGGRRDP
jgi:cyclopropane fatty-acyl-phospholipid synthase-like methyltransferase